MNRYLFLTWVALVITSATVMARSYDINQGSITFESVGNNLQVSQQGSTNDTYYFNIDSFPNILIYGTNTVTANTITIQTAYWTEDSGYIPIITLSNVLIHSSSDIPIRLDNQSVLKMFLAAGTSNELKTTGIGCPGIKASDEAGVPILIIKGSGTLVAMGGESSAGIGGYYLGNAGNIRIEDNVTVIATGGMGGAGIGGGEATAGGDAIAGGGIAISSNAVVIAQGGIGGEGDGITLGAAAGIGGGGSTSFDGGKRGGAGGSITISGRARVTARGGEFAAGIGGGGSNALHSTTASDPGTISIGPNTKVVAFSDGALPAIHDDGTTLDGNGYVMLLNYYASKAAGTTNTVRRAGKDVTNVVAAVAYQSIALSLAGASTYRVFCNNIPQESQGDARFPVLETGLKVFENVADTNSLPFTTTTPEEVPYEWLAEYYPSVDESAYEDLANGDGANGFAVWESYVAGLVPTNATSTFTASITLTNQTPYIAWSPNYPDRVYKVQGKAQLSDSTWGPTNSASRFFNVDVDLP